MSNVEGMVKYIHDHFVFSIYNTEPLTPLMQRRREIEQNQRDLWEEFEPILIDFLKKDWALWEERQNLKPLPDHLKSYPQRKKISIYPIKKAIITEQLEGKTD